MFPFLRLFTKSSWASKFPAARTGLKTAPVTAPAPAPALHLPAAAANAEAGKRGTRVGGVGITAAE